MKTFSFDTGVKPDHTYKLSPGHVIRGTVQIPFDCDDVPDGATFLYACDDGDSILFEGIIRREMKNTTMVSKYAFFRVN